MANNRLYLAHRPSGLYVPLGKRLAFGWYIDPAPDLEKFHESCAEESDTDSQDDFVLCIEDGEGAPECNTGWRMAETEKGMRILFGGEPQ